MRRGGNPKSGGMTPMSSRGIPSRTTLRPRMEGSAPNTERQSRSLMMRVAAAPTASSPGANRRPIAGLTPSAGSTSAVIDAPSSRSGSPPPTRVAHGGGGAPEDLNDPDAPFQSREVDGGISLRGDPGRGPG